MKEMSKVKIYLKKAISSVLSEKRILSSLNYSLIPKLNFSFQDKEYLYIILEYLPGGNLRYYMSGEMRFNESQIKFFISNIILSLKYIHNNNILHRDLKPENLVFDDKGYLHLTDFGISRKIRNRQSILGKSGTPGYLSPEVLLNKPQNFSSDFFSLGVICYELLQGKRPFRGENKMKIAEKILYKDIKLTEKNIPENYSIEMGDFINKLLKRNPKKRLGNKSIDEIMNHPWLEDVEWEIIESKSVSDDYIPFTPCLGDNFDSKAANKKDYIDVDNYDECLNNINNSGYFRNFYFNSYSVCAITKCKTIYKKSNVLQQITIVKQEVKDSNQNEIEDNNNEDTLENNNKPHNLTFGLTSSKRNKRNEENEFEFIRKSKTNSNKSNSIIKRKIKGYEKEQTNDIKKILLLEKCDDNNNNYNDIISNCKENYS